MYTCDTYAHTESYLEYLAYLLSFISDQIHSVCRYNPAAVVPHHSNCAMYWNCSSDDQKNNQYQQECIYPDLFSPGLGRCVHFTNVSCKTKFVPQAPCK